MSATTHSLQKGLRYRLSSRNRAPQIIALHHVTGEVDHILLPFDAFPDVLIAPLPHDAEIHAEGLELRRKYAAPWAKVRAGSEAARIRKKARFAAPLRYGGCILSYRSPAKGAPRQSLIDNRGMDLGSESLATLLSSEMLLDALPALPDKDAPAPAFSGTIAIVLHLHYPELWDEFAAVFAHSGLTFRLIVTLTAPDPDLADRITAQFPDAHIRTIDNLGRDIRPFVTVLQSGLLDGVDLVCKLHGKRSLDSGVTGARFGHLWRRRALLDLLGSPRHVQAILNRFDTQPRLGMVGPATLRLKNGSGTDPGFKASQPIRQDLCVKTGLDPAHITDDFFAGTMFWVRRTALEPLRNLALPDNLYTQENAQTGDQFEHALERFFADCTRAQDMRLGDIEPLALVGPETQLRSDKGEILAPHALFEAPRAMYRHRWATALPDDLSGQNVALVTTPVLVERVKAQGWLTALCATSEPTQPSPADALFLRDPGGFEMALFADALRSAPQLWQAEAVQLVTQTQTISLPRAALQNSDIRATLSETLVWHRSSETRHRTTQPLKALLQK